MLVTSRRRSTRLLALAIGAVVVLASAGCGIKPSEQAAAAEAATTRSQTVRMGFVVLDTKSLESALGRVFADSGDLSAQIQALVADVNAKGGVGGRPLEAVIKVYEAFGDNKLKEEQLCKAFTQDEKVFAVVLIGQFQSNARPCYAKAKTLMLDQTTFPLVQQDFEKLAPYLWQPSFPEYGALLTGLIEGLGRNKFFSDAITGVIGIDSPENRRLYERELAPELLRLGVKPVDIRWIDNSSSASLQSGQDQAILSFKGLAVDRLVVVGGQRLAAFMMETGKKQKFFPKYAMTTWDNPEFNISNYPDAMAGAVGVSVQAGFDSVPEAGLPFPSGPGETACMTRLAAAGQKFEARLNARQALQYCDAVDLLYQAFKGYDGPLSAEVFAERVQQLGSEYVSAATYTSSYGPGDFAGANGYRTIQFDESCRCMELTGEITRFTK